MPTLTAGVEAFRIAMFFSPSERNETDPKRSSSRMLVSVPVSRFATFSIALIGMSSN